MFLVVFFLKIGNIFIARDERALGAPARECLFGHAPDRCSRFPGNTARWEAAPRSLALPAKLRTASRQTADTPTTGGRGFRTEYRRNLKSGRECSPNECPRP